MSLTPSSQNSNPRSCGSKHLGCVSRSSRAQPLRAEKPSRLIRLDILGNERPGIVRDVTKTLTDLGVNIEEFSSGLEGEPFTGVEMFRASARLRAPDGLSLDDLRKALERLASEIMVDLAVGEDAQA